MSARWRRLTLQAWHLQVVQSSWDSALEQHNGQLHGVLSNPPYIPQAVMAGLQVRQLSSAAGMCHAGFASELAETDLTHPNNCYAQAEVLQHEPHLALLGHGETGLEQLQSVCQAATRLLAPGGFLGVETGGEPSPNHVLRVASTLPMQ